MVVEGEGVPVRHVSSNVNGTDLTWKSPVPYLFGGIGAMLTLIGIALFILLWSFMKSSRQDEGNNGEPEIECGDKSALYGKDMEDKAMVIMPGDEKPSCLAQPAIKFLDLAGKSK